MIRKQNVMPIYEIVLAGDPSLAQAEEVRLAMIQRMDELNLSIGGDVNWLENPSLYVPNPSAASVIIFFGSATANTANISNAVKAGLPVLTVATDENHVESDIPSELRHINCLMYDSAGPLRVSTATLETLRLLPGQRRVFVSYRRKEARRAAIQLFEELSSRGFNVFLDTHSISAGKNFQDELWDQMCDSEVLIMLDTETYFESRWAAQEFGRALAKGIIVLRVGWPKVTLSSRVHMASRLDLAESDFEPDESLVPEAIDRLVRQVELVRSKGQAVRALNMRDNIRQALELVGGSLNGVGRSNCVDVSLPCGRNYTFFPVLGVPSARTLHEAEDITPGKHVALVFDHVGMSRSYGRHLEWLSSHVKTVRWLKESELAWDVVGL